MKRLFAILAATLITGVVATAETQDQGKEKASSMLKSVIHVNFGDSKRQEHALGNIENILKEVPEAKIEVVSHGEGISLIQKSKSEHEEKIAALVKQGVEFVGCENTMSKKSIGKDDLLAGVSTVPSGAVEVLRKQQDGYGYFRP
jgi:intracellular sulfur oxidation DsrE/DsrF family protein